MNTFHTPPNSSGKIKTLFIAVLAVIVGLNASAQFSSTDGILSTSNFTDLQPKESLTLTHDGIGTAFSAVPLSCALTTSLERTYDVAIKKGDPGLCDLSLDLSMVSGYTDATKIHLLIDTDKTGWPTSLLVKGTVTGSMITFPSVHLTQGATLAFGEGVTAYYAVTSGNFGANIWSESPGGAFVAGPNFCEQVNMIIEAGSNVTMNVTNIHVKNLIIEAGATFNNAFPSDNRTFYINGNLNNKGTYTYTAGTTIFEGSKLQSIEGVAFEMGMLEIKNPIGLEIKTPALRVGSGIRFINGDLYTNDALILKSTATKTAFIGNLNGGQVSGEVTVQRYHNSSTGWFMMGSPVQNQTIADWNDDLVTTGFTGSDYPLTSFNNIRFYDESAAGPKENGFVGVADVNDNIIPKTGYFIYASAGVQQVDVKGDLYQGSQRLPVSYTYGTSSADGICLVANPYASTIDWNSAHWTKTDVSNAVYVWNAATGAYSSYVNGISNNGGSNMIAPSQGFQVKVNSAAAVLVVNEGVKSEVTTQFKSNDNSELLVMEIEWDGFKDAFTLVNDEKSDASFNDKQDATRMPVLEQFPAISAALENESYSIKSINLNADEQIIPLKVFIPENGMFTLSLNENTLDNNQIVWLRDKEFTTVYNLSERKSITFNAENGTDDRFELVISNAKADISSIAKNELSIEIDHLQSSLRLTNTNSDKNSVVVTLWNAYGQKLTEQVVLQSNETRLVPITQLKGQFIVNAIDPISGKSKTKNFTR